ncbi:hypothetical protein A9P82_08910 [Arachidicoccus ginsenosidimutans]|uniref:RNA recognition motif domain-containing protein n=1 Tax=Arachidicoccus sp. BS20 TaxID=1850526 RepID=UPI0007F0BC45|nr:hypothetical protein [Arachidicoccus sp. BS20]ANI89403.1 hypothetical protein A9P82_08910 [Arachidicoccus sp. BS20]
MKIFVSNLGAGITDTDLKGLFESYGTVASATVILDRETGTSRGFGFVEIPDHGGAIKAIAELNGRNVSGKTLKVVEARPKEERPNNAYSFGSKRRW